MEDDARSGGLGVREAHLERGDERGRQLVPVRTLDQSWLVDVSVCRGSPVNPVVQARNLGDAQSDVLGQLERAEEG